MADAVIPEYIFRFTKLFGRLYDEWHFKCQVLLSKSGKSSCGALDQMLFETREHPSRLQNGLQIGNLEFSYDQAEVWDITKVVTPYRGNVYSNFSSHLCISFA